MSSIEDIDRLLPSLRPRTLVSRRASLISLAVVGVFGGCGGGTSFAPEKSLGGQYVLTQVDGVAANPPAEGMTGPCPVAITDGILALQTAGAEIPQGYVITVLARPTCEVNGIPTNPTPVVDDAGGWTLNDSNLHFSSSPSNHNGSYDGQVTDFGGVSGTAHVQVSVGGHVYAFVRLDPGINRSQGISVRVVDQSGAQIAGSLVVIQLADREVNQFISIASGFPLVPAVPGQARVSVAPPTGYSFAPGQASPIFVTINPGQDAAVTVVVARSGA